MNNKYLNFNQYILGVFLAISTISVNAQQLPGAYTSTWLGNTYGGRNDGGGGPWLTANDPQDDWVQNFIECMTVTADGTCYTTSGWDEGGRTKGIYKDGDVLGNGDGVGNCDSAGGYTINGTTITGNGKTITNAGKPTAIAMGDGALAGKLLVADNGIRKQILVYDVSGTGTPTIEETIGANGGIASNFSINYALPAATNSLAFATGTYGPGVYHPLKLWGLTGVGCDNQGRVFVSHSEQGSGIRCFKKVSGNWILDWKVENYCFVDNVFYDEKTDAVDVYGVQEHYKMNFNNNVAGKEWSIYGYSLDVENYPQDPRGVSEIKAGGEHALTGTIMREINGTRYTWVAGMTCQAPNIFKYKTGTEIAVPCGMFWQRNHRIYNLDISFWWPPQKPATNVSTTSFWEDFNDNGKYEANEYTDQSHDFGEGDFMVDKSGNIWQAQNPITVWNASFTANGNIHYSSNNLTQYTITGIPSIGKIVLQEDKDRLVLLTATCRNITGGKVYVVDNWSKGNRAARYVSTLWGPNQASWSAAGDYAFEVGWETRAKVWVTNLSDGSLAGTIEPSNACGGVGRTGWVDISLGIQAYQRKDGEYLVFVEDDGLGRVMLYRWCLSGTCGGAAIPASSVTISEPFASVAVNGNLQLNSTVLPTNCTDKTLSWSSSNTSIATVNSNGIVSGIVTGEVTITATTAGGAKMATCKVTVTAGGNFSSTHTIKLEVIGGGWNYVRYFNYYNGTALQKINYNDPLISSDFLTHGAGWLESNTKDKYTQTSFTGTSVQLYGDKNSGGGTGKIYIDGIYQQDVSFYSATGQSNVLIFSLSGLSSGIIANTAVTGVSMSPTTASVTVNDTTQLSATVAPSNATNKNVTWTSSNTNIATVNSSGQVVGVSVGNATITVTTVDGSKTATCAVSVSAVVSNGCSDQQGTVTCYKTASTITVDGNVDESSWCISNTLNKSAVGTKNNSVTYGVLYDDSNMYIGVKILDANLHAANNASPWQNDGIELYFDPNNSLGTAYDANDRQFTKAKSTLAMSANAGGTTGASVNWVNITGGYTMEFKIPFALLGLTSPPANNTIIGFDIANNDDDDGAGRTIQSIWNGGSDNYTNPSLFGKLVISSTLLTDTVKQDLNIANENEKISIYPIPATDVLNFENFPSEKIIYEIFSIEGKAIKSGIIMGKSITIDDLQKGMYFIKIISEKNNDVFRFVKE